MRPGHPGKKPGRGRAVPKPCGQEVGRPQARKPGLGILKACAGGLAGPPPPGCPLPVLLEAEVAAGSERQAGAVGRWWDVRGHEPRLCGLPARRPRRVAAARAGQRSYVTQAPSGGALPAAPHPHPGLCRGRGGGSLAGGGLLRAGIHAEPHRGGPTAPGGRCQRDGVVRASGGTRVLTVRGGSCVERDHQPRRKGAGAAASAPASRREGAGAPGWGTRAATARGWSRPGLEPPMAGPHLPQSCCWRRGSH